MNLLPLALLFAVVLACNSTKVSPGPDSDTRPTTATKQGAERRVTLNQIKTISGLNITIGEIAIEPRKITVGMTLQNPTKETITFYPSQGDLVIGKVQFKANMFGSDSGMSGEIYPGVEKRGTIVFDDATNNVSSDDIHQIEFRLGKVYGQNIMKAAEAVWTVTL